MYGNTRSDITLRVITASRFALVLTGIGIAASACRDRQAEDAQVSKSPLTNVNASPKPLPATATNSERTLYRKSAACYDCAKAHCAEGLERCESIEGAAANGPAQGKPRAELCRSTLECVFAKSCATEHASFKCYCGKANGVDCASNANGVCKTAIEAGLETTSGSDIAVRFVEGSTGGGVALGLVHCLMDNACKACF